MATLLGQLLSLAAAGTMLLSTSLDAAAPHNDMDGLLFLNNRQWRVSKAFVPEKRMTNVPGQVRNMRPDASVALLSDRTDVSAKDVTVMEANIAQISAEVIIFFMRVFPP